MLPAVRIAFILGFRRVFLLGADFRMVAGKDNYHFAQARSKQSAKNNNNTYQALDWRFGKLRPTFEKNGFHVYNCNADSGLRAFDHVPYSQAIDLVRQELPDTAAERTEGLYDRSANDKAGKGGPAGNNASEVDSEPNSEPVAAVRTMADLERVKMETVE
jgi:hypothetical protein